MNSLRKGFMALCILTVLSTVSYAQSFNNVPVDIGSGDQSETSIAINPGNSAVLMATWNEFGTGTIAKPGWGRPVLKVAFTSGGTKGEGDLRLRHYSCPDPAFPRKAAQHIAVHFLE